MSTDPTSDSSHRPPAVFRPRVTVSLIYLLLFFFGFSFLLIAPALLEVLRTVPPGPEQEEAAAAASQAALHGKPWIALAAALFVTATGVYWRFLPGTRSTFNT